MTYVTLDKADGPKCPHCGCRDSELLKGSAAGSWFGGTQLSRPQMQNENGDLVEVERLPPGQATQGTAVCGHCGRSFAVRMSDSPVVEPEAADRLYGYDEPVVDEAGDAADLIAKKVPFQRLVCPSCKSPDVIVRSTKKAKPPSTRTWRNHFCRACDYTFQSFEEIDTER